jgi:hypothetical protein
MEEDQLKKFISHGKKSKEAGRLEEALVVKVDHNFKLENDLNFPEKIGRMEEETQKNSEDLAKTLEKLEEWKKLWKKKKI